MIRPMALDEECLNTKSINLDFDQMQRGGEGVKKKKKTKEKLDRQWQQHFGSFLIKYPMKTDGDGKEF